MNRRRMINLLRISGSAALIALVLWQGNPASVWNMWRSADLGWIGLALLLQLAGIALSTAKWHTLLLLNGHRLPFMWLLKSYMVGQFANNVLPTTVGGDAVRAAQLSRQIGSLSAAAATVFIDRLTGFFALGLIANAALLWTALPGSASLESAPELQLLAAGGALAALCALIGCFAAPQLLRLLPLQWAPARLRSALERVAADVSAYVPRGRSMLPILVLSLLFQLLWVALHIVCGLALGISAPLFVYALMVPLTDILGLAPIFVNNLGVREMVFTLYLGQVGVPVAQAVALALLIFSVRLVISLGGGLILLFDRSLTLPQRPARADDSPAGVPNRLADEVTGERL